MNIFFYIVTFIATFILGYFTGVYIPLKFRKEDKIPKISIGPFQENQNYFEITNHSGDILNMIVKISWKQENKMKGRELEDFFDKNDDPALGYSHKCNSLKKGETKKVIDCPMYSDNGQVKVIVNGEDVAGKPYHTELVLRNKIKQWT